MSKCGPKYTEDFWTEEATILIWFFHDFVANEQAMQAKVREFHICIKMHCEVDLT